MSKTGSRAVCFRFGTDIEAELITLNEELDDAARRLKGADIEGAPVIRFQVRQVNRQIKSYSKRLCEKMMKGARNGTAIFDINAE